MASVTFVWFETGFKIFRPSSALNVHTCYKCIWLCKDSYIILFSFFHSFQAQQRRTSTVKHKNNWKRAVSALINWCINLVPHYCMLCVVELCLVLTFCSVVICFFSSCVHQKCLKGRAQAPDWLPACPHCTCSVRSRQTSWCDMPPHCSPTWTSSAA